MRRRTAYRQHHVHHTKTRARRVGIGERRKPGQRGKPGYLRADTVHQGNTSTREGPCHIDAAGAVAQWQIVGCCPTIPEGHLIPVSEAMPHQFPFRIQGFHSDNGSEFLNARVEKLLPKPRVGEFTHLRLHRTTGNALVEGKHGAVVRQHTGHEPIGAQHAGEFQRFCMAEFNPYWNYHHPCGLATVEVDVKGQRRRRLYRPEDCRSPCEKLLSPGPGEGYLQPGVMAAFLKQQAGRMSDTECALQMQQPKRKLLAQSRSRWQDGDAQSGREAQRESRHIYANFVAEREHDPAELRPVPSHPPRLYPLERRSPPAPAPLPTQIPFRIILGLENAFANTGRVQCRSRPSLLKGKHNVP